MNFTNSEKINVFTMKFNKIMDETEKQTRKVSSSKKPILTEKWSKTLLLLFDHLPVKLNPFSLYFLHLFYSFGNFVTHIALRWCF